MHSRHAGAVEVTWTVRGRIANVEQLTLFERECASADANGITCIEVRLSEGAAMALMAARAIRCACFGINGDPEGRASGSEQVDVEQINRLSSGIVAGQPASWRKAVRAAGSAAQRGVISPGSAANPAYVVDLRQSHQFASRHAQLSLLAIGGEAA